MIRNHAILSPYAISAGEQIEGKGQRNKHWVSEPFSNILVSFLVSRPRSIEKISQLNHASICAVVDTLVAFGVNNVKVKWPNDVYVNNKKIAGILVETTIAQKEIKNAVVGVGLNVNQTKFDVDANSMQLELGKKLDLVSVLHYLYDSFYFYINKESKDLLRAINNQLFKKGELVTFEVNKRMMSCCVDSILENGNLAVLDDNINIELQHHIAKWVK